jgi:adenylosuccinate lyase
MRLERRDCLRLESFGTRSIHSQIFTINLVYECYRLSVTGMVVNAAVVRREVAAYLPYLITENVIMAGVRQGGDRQELHERIRQHSHAVTARIKEGGANDLIDRLKADPAFAKIDFSTALEPHRYVGRSPQQVDEFLREHVEPALAAYARKPVTASDISNLRAILVT